MANDPIYSGLRVGEIKVVRVNDRKKGCEACSPKSTNTIFNVVVWRTGKDSWGSRNYCDRHLPDRYANLRDEAMAPKRP